MIRKMGKNGKLYVPFTVEEECSGCNEVIDYPDFFAGNQVFIDINDRAWHINCWQTYLLDEEIIV